MADQPVLDDLAPWYHFIFEDWDAHIHRGATVLHQLIEEQWGAGSKRIVDAAAGIGTQAIGLESCGHRMLASDTSRPALQRSVAERKRRGLGFSAVLAEMSKLPVRLGVADILVACDDALPRLETELGVRGALWEWHRCVRSAGGCVIAMSDCAQRYPSGSRHVRRMGERPLGDKWYEVQEVTTWHDEQYDRAFELTEIGAATPSFGVSTRYLAISVDRVMMLMREAGFENLRRVDERFRQSVILGTVAS